MLADSERELRWFVKLLDDDGPTSRDTLILIMANKQDLPNALAWARTGCARAHASIRRPSDSRHPKRQRGPLARLPQALGLATVSALVQRPPARLPNVLSNVIIRVPCPNGNPKITAQVPCLAKSE